MTKKTASKKRSRAAYADGFVIPVSKKNVPAYLKMARIGRDVWLDHGALEYRESIVDDAKTEFCLPFAQGIQAKPGETVFMSWITYKSKAQRDRINAKVMKDPRLAACMDPKKMPFDCARMLYGGFAIKVSE